MYVMSDYVVFIYIHEHVLIHEDVYLQQTVQTKMNERMNLVAEREGFRGFTRAPSSPLPRFKYPMKMK